LYFADTIFPVAGDTIPLNNYEICSAVVVGPYDPNSIEASPKGDGNNGYISRDDSVITYTVRFQNTGSWTAHNVTVEVQLDSDLDLSTFEMQGASFNYTLEVSPSGLAKVVFSGINLADSNYNEAQSHGYFAFSIKQKPNLAEQTQIVASANIYFDFNYPILTNDALNTITGIKIPESATARISIFPNPSRDFFKVDIHLEKPASVTIEVSDAIGNLLLRTSPEKLQQGSSARVIDASSFSKGIYFLRVITDDGAITAKAIRF
jgi:uncharacterized repeat protein (TIGR01451 family)